MQTRFWTQREILARGWTKKLMERWLGEPDRLETNPHRPSAAPMRLYDRDRVLGCEFIDGWRAEMEKVEEQRATRRAAAEKAKATRRRNAEERAKQPFTVFGFGGPR